MVALTSSEHHEPAAPSAAYLRTILAGLTDGLLEVDAAITYLLSAPGVDLRWDGAEHPRDGGTARPPDGVDLR